MIIRSKALRDAIYAKFKGPSVSRNYDIRMALEKGEKIPPPPRLNIVINYGPSYGETDKWR